MNENLKPTLIKLKQEVLPEQKALQVLANIIDEVATRPTTDMLQASGGRKRKATTEPLHQRHYESKLILITEHAS